jgi:hypothetical protein
MSAGRLLSFAAPRACRTGVYSIQGIVDHFGGHSSTVSRAVRWLAALEQADN